ncbi:hypothetical protein ACNOYE_39030 [Nannocystaceae bacterium ST9]
MLHRFQSLASLAFLALLPLTGCPSTDDAGDDAGDDVGDDAGEDAGETEAGDSEADSDASGPQTSDATSVDATDGADTADGADSADTTDGTDTTGGEPTHEEQCIQGCALFLECGFGGTGCVEECLKDFAVFEGECIDHIEALVACVSALTCDEVDQYVGHFPDPWPCKAESEALCEDYCEVSVTTSEEPGVCSFHYDCTDGDLDMPELAVECDGQECKCYGNGEEQFWTCDPSDICGDPSDIAAINACCKWQLPTD